MVSALWTAPWSRPARDPAAAAQSSKRVHLDGEGPAVASGRVSGLQHVPGLRGTQAWTPAFDRADDLKTTLGVLLQSEHIFGVYASTSEVSFIAVTNRRVVMWERKTYDMPVLTSAPFSRISSVSYVLPSGLSASEAIAYATTVQMKVGYTSYEVACIGKEQAHEVHDLITWNLLNM